MTSPSKSWTGFTDGRPSANVRVGSLAASGTPAEESNIMVTLKNGLAILTLGLAVTTFASYGLAQERGIQISAARAAAIQECSIRASKYLELAWGVVEIQVYRTCMAEHHQIE
jgi:hypothetical protein